MSTHQHIQPHVNLWLRNRMRWIVLILSALVALLHFAVADAAPIQTETKTDTDTMVSGTADVPLINSATVAGGGALLPSTSNLINTSLALFPSFTVRQAADATAFLGQPFTITVAITNTGSADTSGQILLTSALPTGLDFVSGSGSDGFTCSATAITVTCSTSQSLAVGEVATVDLVYDPTLLGPIVHLVTVSGGGALLPTVSLGLNIDILGLPAFAVSQTADSTAFLGQPFTITVAITNTGSADTSGQILLTSALPTGLDFVSGSGSDGFTCSATAITVTCSTSQSLAVDEVATVDLVYDPTLLGPIIHLVTVSGGGALLPAVSLGLNIDILGLPAFTVRQAADATAFLGQPFTITVAITNTGSEDTSGQILLTSALPTGLDFVSGSGSDGFTCSATAITVTCSTSQSLAVDEVATVDLVYDPTLLGPIIHLVTVSGGGALLPAASLGLNIDILGLPAFAISLAGPAVATQYQPFTYTITITNVGSSPTVGTITVLDPLPVGVEYMESNATDDFVCSEELLTVTCVTDTSILTGTKATINLIVNPIGVGVISNSVTMNQTATTLTHSDTIQTTVKALTVTIDPAQEPLLNRTTAKAMVVRGQSVRDVDVTVTVVDLLGNFVEAVTPTDEDGRYEVPFDVTSLADGSLTINAIATNELNHVSEPATAQVELDATAPEPPIMVTPPDGSVLEERRPLLRGTAEAGTTLTLMIADQTLTTEVDSNGQWVVTPGLLADGPYTPLLTVSDQAGNRSDERVGNRFTIQATDRTTVDQVGKIYLPFVSR